MKKGEYMFWFAQNWLGFPGREAFINKLVHVLDKLGRFCHPDIKNPFVFLCHHPEACVSLPLPTEQASEPRMREGVGRFWNLWAVGEFASSVMCSETGIFL